MEGLDIERMPFNNDNFMRMRKEVAELRDLVMKLNAKIVTQEKAVVKPKAPVKKGK